MMLERIDMNDSLEKKYVLNTFSMPIVLWEYPEQNSVLLDVTIANL